MTVPIVVRITVDDVVLSLRKLATKLVSSFYFFYIRLHKIHTLLNRPAFYHSRITKCKNILCVIKGARLIVLPYASYDQIW